MQIERGLREAVAMRAVTQEVYGEPGVLELSDVGRPVAAHGEVVVRVRAAGVDRGVWHVVTGLPFVVRLAGFGLRRPKHPIPGLEFAGDVVDVGPGSERFRVGDEVFGICDGAFAEYATAREGQLADKPGSLTFEQAATVPVSGVTALQALRDVARVRADQSVLVLGASGGVGTHAVQLAVSFGARVTAVCSAAKAELVESLGAHRVLDYAVDRLDGEDGGYDVILDLGGNRPLRRVRKLLARDGTLVIVGGENGGRWTGGSGRQLRALMLSSVVRQRLRTFISKTEAEDLRAIGELAEAGELTPVVGGTYPLATAADALRDLVNGRVKGKAVLVP